MLQVLPGSPAEDRGSQPLGQSIREPPDFCRLSGGSGDPDLDLPAGSEDRELVPRITRRGEVQDPFLQD